MNVFRRSLAIAVAGVAFAGSVSGAQDAASATDALVSFVAANGKVALVGGRYVTKLSAELAREGDCAVLLRSTMDVEGRVTMTEKTLTLSALSPDATVREWAGGKAFSVMVRPSSGKSEIPTRTVKGTGPNGPAPFAELTVENRASADSLRQLVSGAVTKCGGAPPSPEVLAQLAADSAAKAKADSLEELAPDVRKEVIAVCRERIRSQLRAPTTAVFDGGSAEPDMLRMSRGSPTILGKVEAENALGGRLSNSYMCTFEKFGSRFTPKLATLLR